MIFVILASIAENNIVVRKNFLPVSLMGWTDKCIGGLDVHVLGSSFLNCVERPIKVINLILGVVGQLGNASDLVQTIHSKALVC